MEKKSNESSENIDHFSELSENKESGECVIRRKLISKTFQGTQLPPLNNLPILKSKSTRLDSDDEEEEEQASTKKLRQNCKFKTFMDLRNDKQQTQSMLQIPETAFSQLVINSQNSYNSLTSLEGMQYRNSLEGDFEDEELSQDYRTLEYIGQGYHAIVKKVINIVSNEVFAAKITRINDEEISIAIHNEYEILRKLDHPYIMKAYRLIRNPSKSLITMITEYVDCKNLTIYITKNGKNISEIIALKILKKLLIAVEYLHNNFICHRDISPQNILVSEDINVFKLVDFGVSKIFMDGQNPIEMITPTGLPGYRAPEIRKGDKPDEKIDLWNSGHVFFELLKGRHVSSKKLIKIIKEKELMQYLTSYSENTKEIVARLLEINPKKRIGVRECLKNKVFDGL